MCTDAPLRVDDDAPLPYFVRDNRRYQAFVAVRDNPDAPTWQQAMASPDRELWLDGAVREVQSLFKRDSMEIVLKADFPSAEPLPSMFVCKKKRNELNEVVVYKFRLVAGGHKQVEDVHYDPNDIYAPTVAQLTAKLIFEAAIQKTLDMLQADVETAYLIPRLRPDEYILLRPPLGFHEAMLRAGLKVPPKYSYWLRLLACIYGLKQASNYWYNKLLLALISFGWVQCNVDKCLFVKYDDSTPPVIIAYLVYYVDDICVCATAKMIEELKKNLSSQFPMKFLGFPSTFTGITVRREPGGAVTLHQETYTKRAIDMLGFGSASISNSPTAVERPTDEPATEEQKVIMAAKPYRRVQGSALWMNLTCPPDLCFAVHQTGRRAADPRPVDWTGAKRIFRYLKGTSNFGITFRPVDQSTHAGLVVYSDSDWAGT